MGARVVVTMRHTLSDQTQRASRAAFDAWWRHEGWVEESSEEFVPEEDEKPVDKMKVDELKAHADKHGVNLGDATTKADILAVIELATLRKYAEENGIDLGDATDKDDIAAAIELAEEGK